MSWLVTGGAGYIGSHVVQAFLAAGITPVVIDDLSSGHAEFVPAEVAFVKGSILDTDLVTHALRDHGCEGVVHLAGFKYAGVSVREPLHTYDQNVTGTVSLLRAMQVVGVHNYVFSSSASVYGTPNVDLVTEETPTAPESPYGQTKLIGEWLAADMAAVDPRLALHQSALLQRRRVGFRPALRHQSAQPLPDRLRCAVGRPGAEDLR